MKEQTHKHLKKHLKFWFTIITAIITCFLIMAAGLAISQWIMMFGAPSSEDAMVKKLPVPFVIGCIISGGIVGIIVCIVLLRRFVFRDNDEYP